MTEWLMNLLAVRTAKRGLIFAWALSSSASFAQRGASFEGQAEPWDTVTQGFPGYFDTNVAEKGSLVVEFPPAIYFVVPGPFAAIDYGVSETLTVGTNAVVTGIPWLFGAAGASIKVRSLLFGDPIHQSAATYYGGLIQTLKSEKPLNVYYQAFTWNHAYRPAERHTLYAHAHYLRLDVGYGKETSLDRASIALTNFMVGGGYGFDFSKKWTLKGNLLIPIQQEIELDTVAVALSQSQTVGRKRRLASIYSGQLEYRVSPKWLLGFGFTGSAATQSEPMFLPWFSWARRW